MNFYNFDAKFKAIDHVKNEITLFNYHTTASKERYYDIIYTLM